jgi:hypothetical protein
MNTQSAVTDIKSYEQLIKGVEQGLQAVDKVTGLSKPFELKIEDETIELTRKEIERVCDCKAWAEQYGELLKQEVNTNGELGKCNDFNILLTMNSVMGTLELALNNAFTMTPARAFCHAQVFMNQVQKKEIIYESFTKYVNNMLTDAKEPNTI